MTAKSILPLIARRLHEKGLTQQEIADKMGFKKQNMSRMLKGHVDPKISTFFKLTEASDIDVTIDGVNIKDIWKQLNKEK